MTRCAAIIGCALLAVPAWAQNSVVELSEQALNKLAGRLASPSDGGVHNAIVLGGAAGYQSCEPFGFLNCRRPGPTPAIPPGAPTSGGSPYSQVPPDRVQLVRCKTAGGTRILASGPPVAWQWWVTDAHFTVSAGSMSLTATVRTRIGTTWDTTTRTVEAVLEFDPATDQLRIKPSAFKVPLRYMFQGVQQTITAVDVAGLYGLAVHILPQHVQVPLPDGSTRSLTARAVSISPQYLDGMISVALDLAFN